MTQEEVKICQVCQHENESDAVECAQCGAPLRSYKTTLPVPEEPTDTAPYRQQTVPPEVPSDTIALFIVGQSQPLMVRGNKEILLGRHVPGESQPTVDLTDYGAHLLGVSRQHALIRFSEQGYTIQDLNSTNGTWLNENRLLPDNPHVLQNGDLVRLGQLIMVVYFSAAYPGDEAAFVVEEAPASGAAEGDAAPIRTIFLRDESADAFSRQKPGIQYLMVSVSPYLQAITETQHLLDEVSGREPAEVGIDSISVENSFIRVTLQGGAEAVQLVLDKLIPRRRDYFQGAVRQGEWDQEELAAVRSPGTRILGGEETGPPAEESQPDAADRVDDNGPPPVTGQVQIDVAREMLDQVAPELSEDEKEAYVGRLLPHLQTLIASPIVLVGVR